MSRIYLEGLDDCTRCERLQQCMQQLLPAKGRNRSEYHNSPVSGFGDLKASVCLVGLAPGAHGANRTGRPFTGDGAGVFMYPLLYESGFSNQPEAVSAEDGLSLQGLYITNAVKCLPPENKPNAGEFEACRSYLAAELAALSQLKVVIALGHGAFTSLLRLFKEQGQIKRVSDLAFAHGSAYLLPNGLWLVGCYHTSRYNVQTGRMTPRMFRDLLGLVRSLVAGENG